MKSLAPYIDEMQQAIGDLFRNLTILVKIKDHGPGEKSLISYTSGKVAIESDTPLAAAYALNRVSIGLASGHLPECLGEYAPHFPLRPLWLVESPMRPFSDKTCRRLIELGYNAVVLECGFDKPLEHLNLIKSYGLKVILKPVVANSEGCFLDVSFNTKLSEQLAKLKGFDWILWEASFAKDEVKRHPTARKFLQRDLALKEVQFIEHCLNKTPLIYFVPVEHSCEWLSDFCDDVSNRTIVSFLASVSGQPHPLWQSLRSNPVQSSTLLLPIIGNDWHKQSNGRWPILPLDPLEKYVPRCAHLQCCGAAFFGKSVPEKGGWMDAALWVAGHSLWSKQSPDILAETWFAALRPNMDYSSHSYLLRDAYRLAGDLNRLKMGKASSEKNKLIAESVLAQLKALDVHSIPFLDKRPNLVDYFKLFEYDAKKMLAEYIPTQRHLNLLEENQEVEIQKLEKMINQEIKENL